MFIHVSISDTVSYHPILWENPRVCPHICHKNEIITALSLISWGFFVPIYHNTRSNESETTEILDCLR